MAEPNFWIDNAGSIITAGAALLGTLGGGIATNWIQNRTRKAEELKRDRDREIEAISAALVVCRRWETMAWELSWKKQIVEEDIKGLQVRDDEVFAALNSLTFLIGDSTFDDAVERTLGEHYDSKYFLERKALGDPSKASASDRVAIAIEEAEGARMKLEVLARQRIFGKKTKKSRTSPVSVTALTQSPATSQDERGHED